jgi:hypothetical protein
MSRTIDTFTEPAITFTPRSSAADLTV